ncbi:MAG: hypothetical protein Tsb0034_03700 [Ekhidna sp.]
MTLTQIQELNEGFQKRAVQLSELIPSGGLVSATASIIRSVRTIHDEFLKILSAKEETQFTKIMGALEDEMDEVIFILDQLEIANKKQQISLIEDFLKEGYGLMSVYSKCCDYVIEQKVKQEE